MTSSSGIFVPPPSPERLASLSYKCDIAGAWVVESRERLAHMVSGHTGVPYSNAISCSVLELISVLEGLDLGRADRVDADHMIETARDALARARSIRTKYSRSRAAYGRQCHQSEQAAS